VPNATYFKTILSTGLGITPPQYDAFNFYKKNTMSIEILKDDSLQKINFRVKNKVPLVISFSQIPVIIETKKKNSVLFQLNIETVDIYVEAYHN